ncbi:MAG: aminopeptidase [Chlorobi bacterium]|nr:aminopeptidase [Chlorobiota bacterium]
MKRLVLLSVFLFSIQIFVAQTRSDFTVIKQVKTTPVKNQQLTGTCWSFATTSFLESEILRTSNKEVVLSPMYFVYYAYIDKGYDYVRHHGNFNLSEGGQAHDVMNVIRRYGLVPQSAYGGKPYDYPPYLDHSEMAKDLHSVAKNAVDGAKEVLNPTWILSYKGILNALLGTPPEKFSYKGKTYTPVSFNKEVAGINPDDYVEFTSYTHHPFYELIDLELPDNWAHEKYYNIPVDDLTKVMNYALDRGFSVDWDGDVSEENWNNEKGTATLRDIDKSRIKDSDYQKYRQRTFDNFTTTDDHLMHITGLAKDKNGNLYYITKNSWGKDYNKFGGYVYMSEDYVKVKTIAVMVHKDAVPDDIAKKCGIK